jgi:hypothetical protein
MPLTLGAPRSLHIHPLVTVLMIFVGGALSGVVGLMLVLPLLGVVMVIGETLGAPPATRSGARKRKSFSHSEASPICQLPYD